MQPRQRRTAPPSPSNHSEPRYTPGHPLTSTDEVFGRRTSLEGLDTTASTSPQPIPRAIVWNMASPATPSPDPHPAPTLLSANTPQAIRDALVGSERSEFEQRYAQEMAAAAHTLNLTGVLTVLDTYRKIADITQRQGPSAHQRMLDQVTRLQNGQDVPTVPGQEHKAHINTRLSH
jgi:hypothetical protein